MTKYAVSTKTLLITEINVIEEKHHTIRVRIDGGEICWMKRHKTRYIFDTEKQAKEFLVAFIHDRIITHQQSIDMLTKHLEKNNLLNN